MLRVAAVLTAVALTVPVSAQSSPPSAKPEHAIHADVLLIVAHPDDELGAATLLAHAADTDAGAAAVYVTSGNAGRNWVGPEQGKSLGRIREVEARMAEHAIGVNQVWFLEQPDTPSQNVMLSLGGWNHGEVVRELVRLIRLLRPSTVITMSPRSTSGENHGDHQAAAVSAVEAFDLAGDPTVFPEQLAEPREREDILDGLKPWQPKRLLFTGFGTEARNLPSAAVTSSLDDVSPRTKETYGQMIADAWQWHRSQHRDGGGMTLGPGANPPRSRARSGSTTYFLAKDMSAAPASAPPLPAFRLGGNWEFYQQLWRTHHLNHPEVLDALALSIQPQDTLRLPLIFENRSDSPAKVAVSCRLPQGWTSAETPRAEQTVAARGSGQFEFVLHSPAAEGDGKLDCSATANGQDAGALEISASVSSRTMRQGIAASER